MGTIVIVGSGPAAAGAAISLSETDDVLVVDVGSRLDPAIGQLVSQVHQGKGTDEALRALQVRSNTPQRASRSALPEKRVFGSDYPFRDEGQRNGVSAVGSANATVISGAYGGFSNVWGSQVMPYSRATFRDWPFSYDELAPHYEVVLRNIPYAGEQDALADVFPLMTDAMPLPPLSRRSAAVLERALDHHLDLDSHGVRVGRARLALDARGCVSCGNCLTGCPYDLIYSARHTLTPLVQHRSIRYEPGYLVVRVGEEPEGSPFVDMVSVTTGERHRVNADAVFLAAGAIGTTRIVANSLNLGTCRVTAQESVQFVVPFLSGSAYDITSDSGSFTLNQFNIALSLDKDWYDVAQVHCYPYNDGIRQAIPRVFQTPWARSLGDQLLKHTSIGLGYLPSWRSPSIELHFSAASDSFWKLPSLSVDGYRESLWKNATARRFVKRLLQVAPAIDLWPAVPGIFFAGPAKSYHFGGTFPHSRHPADGRLTTDVAGRLPNWHNVHLIDGSVLPTIAATTFTLTVMANAHRIAGMVVGVA